MDFTDDYFKEETKCGFTVSEPMKRYWAHCLQIFDVLDDLCKRHNIRYFATWGTLLGAIREGGFIPWDDDIDVMMLRSDYTSFVKYAVDELPAGWTALNYHDSPERFTGIHRIYEVPKIRLSDTDLAMTYGCPFAAGIDVFILDDCPNNEEEMESQVALLNLLYGVAGKLLQNPGDEETLEYISKIEEITGMNVGENPDKYPERLFDMMELVCAMYDDMQPPKYGSNTKVRDLAFTIGGGKTGIFKKSYFAESVMFPFENRMMPVPAAYDAVLRVQFGDDYMTPKQVAADHAYPVYKNQQKKIEKMYVGAEGDELLRKLHLKRGVYR